MIAPLCLPCYCNLLSANSDSCLTPWNLPALPLQSSLHLSSKPNSNHPRNPKKNTRPNLPNRRRTDERKKERKHVRIPPDQLRNSPNLHPPRNSSEQPQFYNRRECPTGERTNTHTTPTNTLPLLEIGQTPRKPKTQNRSLAKPRRHSLQNSRKNFTDSSRIHTESEPTPALRGYSVADKESGIARGVRLERGFLRDTILGVASSRSTKRLGAAAVAFV